MKIGQFDLNKDVLIVAEIGNNHEGSYTLAEEMIGLAAKAGADAVKFQMITPSKLVSSVQKERLHQLERFQLSYEEFNKLSKVAKQENIMFLATPFDLQGVTFLDSLVPAFKVSSGDNNFFPLLEAIAKTGKPLILSTGLVDLHQIGVAKTYIEGIWQEAGIRQEIALLHCVVSYPVPLCEANLLAIQQLQRFGATVGYSDHTIGIEAAVLSIAIGARIIEKHFTIAKNHSSFRDHQLSADPQDLASLVQRVQEAKEMLGDGDKRILDIEKKNLKIVRRSIVAARDLERETILGWDDLTWVRPGGGLPPGNEDKILGKSLKRPIQQGEMILVEDILY